MTSAWLCSAPVYFSHLTPTRLPFVCASKSRLRTRTRPRGRARYLRSPRSISRCRLREDRGVFHKEKTESRHVRSTEKRTDRAQRHRKRICKSLARHRAEDFGRFRSEEHTSELQSLRHLVCRLLLEK